MLIEFRTGNYRSFKDPAALSMLAANPIKEHQEENVFTNGRYRLLRSAAVYGANASGKSNLLNALVFMRWFVINSSKEGQAQEAIDAVPFKLDIETETKPSLFEATFLIEGIRYRYGFEASRKRIFHEWLFESSKIQETPVFLREGEDIEVSPSFKEGRGLEERTRDNALFLSVVANFNGQKSLQIITWFQKLVALHGLREMPYASSSISMLSDEDQRDDFLEFMRKADLGIRDLRVKEEDLDTSTFFQLLSEEAREQLKNDLSKAKQVSISTVHNKYRNTELIGTTTLDFEGDESAGTQKFFNFAGPILLALKTGLVVVVDELEAKLHPILTQTIVRLFLSAKTNPNNAQLVFATHDTNLLRNTKLRRDQIWFTEKSLTEASDLYSLAEIKLPAGMKVRKDASFDKNYFQGKYGAVPFLGDLEQFVEDMINE